MSYDDFFESFCKLVLEADYFIRFAGIATNVGHIMAIRFRSGLIPLLTKEETERAVFQAAIRVATRKASETKIGEPQFPISRYAKVVWATVPIKSTRNNKLLLLLSFDIDAEVDSIIYKKILPLIQSKKEYFL